MQLPDFVERRKAPRLPVWASARISRDGLVTGAYLIDDLSLGGARLHGSPLPPAEHDLGVRIRFPDGHVVSASARTRRADSGWSGAPVVGIEFLDVPLEGFRVLREELRRAAQRLRVHRHQRVLVVDPDPMRRRRLLHGVQALGFGAREAPAPLDAVMLLEDQGPFFAALVAETPGHPMAAGVLSFLASTYPEVRRIVIRSRFDRTAAPGGNVEGILMTPWTMPSLESVMSGAA